VSDVKERVLRTKEKKIQKSDDKKRRDEWRNYSLKSIPEQINICEKNASK